MAILTITLPPGGLNEEKLLNTSCLRSSWSKKDLLLCRDGPTSAEYETSRAQFAKEIQIVCNSGTSTPSWPFSAGRDSNASGATSSAGTAFKLPSGACYREGYSGTESDEAVLKGHYSILCQGGGGEDKGK